MRIAVVHEWFTRWAGSEAVLEQILACLPDADLFAIASCPDEEGQRRLAGRTVRTSFIQRLPFGARSPQLWLPLLPLAAEQLDLRGYDLVVSNSHCVAKGVITSPDCLHLAYVHSPARYAWDLQHEYQSRVPWPLRPLWAAQMARLRTWDAASASRPTGLAANSAYIARRIRRAWGREAEVIHPPVDIAAFTPGGTREDVYLTASRLVGYKRVPLIAEAFAAMPGRRLRIIGDGADLARVRAIAARAPNIEVLGHVPRSELIAHLRRSRAFIFAAEEDFGIVPVEAMACGTPVLAFARGGAAESVLDGRTGRLFAEQTAASIIDAVGSFERAPTPDPADCRARAEEFSPGRFRERFSEFMSRHLRAASSPPMGTSSSVGQTRRVAAVWTRDPEPDASAGRPRIIAVLRSGPLRDAHHVRLRHALEANWPQRIAVAARWLWRLATLRPMSLQCALYASPSMVQDAVSAIGDASIVYIDGVRCVELVRRIARPGLRIVCDLDDLMSRRSSLQLAAGEPPNLGYMAARVPSPIRTLIRWTGGLTQRYESWTLRQAERDLARMCDAIALLSPLEAAELRGMLPECMRPKVLNIPPPQSVPAHIPSWTPPVRFVFVGGELLAQNRLTLERLFRFWSIASPNSELHWFGRREPNGLAPPPGVVCHGYVADISVAYSPNSVLLNPSALGGGVKTKMLEAIAHGCPAVANPAAVEGLDWPDYPLILPDDDTAWIDLISHPYRYYARFTDAVVRGIAYLRSVHDPVLFSDRWKAVVSGDASL